MLLHVTSLPWYPPIPTPHTEISTGCTREAPGGKHPTGVSGNTGLASQKLELPLPYSMKHCMIIPALLGYSKQHRALSVVLVDLSHGVALSAFLLGWLVGPGSFSRVFPPHLAPAKHFLAVFLKLPCPRSSSLKGAHCTPRGRWLCSCLHISKTEIKAEDQHCVINTCKRKLLLNNRFIFTMLQGGDG